MRSTHSQVRQFQAIPGQARIFTRTAVGVPSLLLAAGRTRLSGSSNRSLGGLRDYAGRIVCQSASIEAPGTENSVETAT